MSGASSIPTSAANGKAKSPVGALVSVAIAALLAGGGAAWLFAQRNSGVKAALPIVPITSERPKVLVHLDGFTVNLADPEETHFLRVTIDLGLDHAPRGSSDEKPNTLLPIPRIRDTILSVLTICKANALLTREGKAQLKKDLFEALSRDVPEAGIREVYFTEFLVQR